MCQSVMPISFPEMGGLFFSATFTQLVTAGELSRALLNVESGSITFSDGDLSASVGCNNVFGAAELTLGNLSAGVPDTLVLTGPLASTKMYCDGLMEAEAALISILEGEFLSLVGDGITSSNGIIRIEGGVPIAMADVVTPQYPPFMIQIDGTNYDVASGYVIIDGDTLTLDGPLISTMMYCEGLMDAEAALATVLQGENLTWVSQFELRSDAGAVIFAALCGDCVTPLGEPSDPTGLALAVMLLFAPIGSAAVALSRGLATKN
jgi:heat shock protein HslJ